MYPRACMRLACMQPARVEMVAVGVAVEPGRRALFASDEREPPCVQT
jgi:hypothetical protein